MAQITGGELVRFFSQLQSKRTEYESNWRDCYRFTFPQLGTGFSGSVSHGQAEMERALLLDSTGTDATRVLASTIASGMTPANERWLDLVLSDSMQQQNNDNASRWLSEAADKVWKNIHNSNYDAESYSMMLDSVICGWGVLFATTDPERGGFIFQHWPAYQCWMASTNGRSVDIIIRKYDMSAAEAYKEFGDNVSQKVRDQAEKHPDERVNFLHVIMPRDTFHGSPVMAKNMPFASYHIDMADKAITRESGYHEFPCFAPRFVRLPNSVYGTGPVFDALPDIKELNALKRLEKAAAEIAVSGMWIATDDGVLNPRTIQLGPRKIIVANDVNNIKPLQTGADFNVAFQSEERLQGAIRRVLMADQLNTQGNSNTTATEVNARLAMIRQQLGPVFGRLQSELLIPMVERCFNLMLRDGALGEPPEELQGVNFHVVFVNPLARAQKLGTATAIQQAMGIVMQYAQTNPELADVLDFDESVREISESLGVPAHLLRSKEDVDTARQQRAQAQQAQQAQSMSDQLNMQNASEQITAANTAAAPQTAA